MPSIINSDNGAVSGSAGLKSSADSSGVLALQTNGTTAVTVDASQNVGIGTVSPTTKLNVSSAGADVEVRASTTTSGNVRFGFDADGAYYNWIQTNRSSGAIQFAISNSEVMRLDASGNLGLGVTPSAWESGAKVLQISVAGSGGTSGNTGSLWARADSLRTIVGGYFNGSSYVATASNGAAIFTVANGSFQWQSIASTTSGNTFSPTAVMTLDASGNLLVGKTSTSATVAGFLVESQGDTYITAEGVEGNVLYLNRLTSDGDIVLFAQANTTEGSISVSGTTVSYNGGHLSRWAQTTAPKDDTLVKGTVLSNLDAMNVYTDADGNPVANEQLNKVKVSDVEGDANVAGVFVNWTHDEDHNVDEINMAMTGDMIIRIAQGVTVARGDLLMSAGNGTAKPQGDDIVRSKTVAKVTSTHVTCTYADGSYCVPCVLMAC